VKAAVLAVLKNALLAMPVFVQDARLASLMMVLLVWAVLRAALTAKMANVMAAALATS
jgi:hypothetical protein